MFSKLSSHAWYSMVGHFFSSLNCFTKQRFQTMVPNATILPHGNNTLYSEVKAHSRNSLAIDGFFTSLLSCGSSIMISFGLAPLIGCPLVTVSMYDQLRNSSSFCLHLLSLLSLVSSLLVGTIFPKICLIFLLFSSSLLIFHNHFSQRFLLATYTMDHHGKYRILQIMYINNAVVFPCHLAMMMLMSCISSSVSKSQISS